MSFFNVRKTYEPFWGIGDGPDQAVTNIVEDNIVETASDLTHIYMGNALDCTNFNEIALYDCNLKDDKLQQVGMCKLNEKLEGDTKLTQKIDQIAKQKADQTAKEISQTFGILPGSTDATNIAKSTASATSTMAANIKTTCAGVADPANIVTCGNVSGLYGNYIKQSTIDDVTMKCLLSDEIVNQTTQKLTQTTSQYASSTVQNSIFWIMIASICLLISWVIFKILGGRKLARQIIILMVVALVIVILISWLYTHMHKNELNHPYGSRCADCTKFGRKEECETAMCSWTNPLQDVVDKSVQHYPSLSPLCICNEEERDCSSQCYKYNNKSDCEDALCGWDDSHKKCTGYSNYCHERKKGDDISYDPSKVALYILIIVAVVFGALGAWYFVSHHKSEGKKEGKKVKDVTKHK